VIIVGRLGSGRFEMVLLDEGRAGIGGCGRGGRVRMSEGGQGMQERREGVISQLEQMQSNKIELCGDEQRVCGGLTYRRR